MDDEKNAGRDELDKQKRIIMSLKDQLDAAKKADTRDYELIARLEAEIYKNENSLKDIAEVGYHPNTAEGPNEKPNEEPNEKPNKEPKGNPENR